jgi:hypothetical protein
MTESDSSSHQQASREPRTTHPGPSWGLMLFFIALAMLAAIAIAWAFVTPLLHRHF